MQAETKYLWNFQVDIQFISSTFKKKTNVLDGYTADKVLYKWSHGAREALKLHAISLPDFQITEAYVTSHMESYATGLFCDCDNNYFFTVDLCY